MKRLTIIFYLMIALMIFIGCSDNSNEQPINDTSENNSILEADETDENTSTNDVGESEADDSDYTSTENNNYNEDEKENEETLSQYSHEQIEYARIWLQLGPNQALDELYVQHIPAGEPLNRDDETSANYPEDVIQLSGTRLVDGSVTYSGNGDGTINVYNVPLRWDGVNPAGEEFYQEIIDNTELISVDTGDDEEIIALINLLND